MNEDVPVPGPGDPGRLEALCSALAEELKAMQPFLGIMREQLSGAVAESDGAVVEVITRINTVHGLSAAQAERIEQSMRQCLKLVEATREQAGFNREVMGLVRTELDTHGRELAQNLARTRDLNQEVRELRRIVELITDIAGQTRLLAINAAIQATHAGAAGAAFAVVAAEVKTLSARTTGAAREIADKIGRLSERMTGEMALAEAGSGVVEASDRQLRGILEEVEALEARYAEAGGQLQGVLGTLRGSNAEVVAQLTGALGQLQFQDVLRQRLEQVGHGLEDLAGHARELSLSLADGAWEGAGRATLEERLARHAASYVMASQRSAHAQVLGGTKAEDSGPAIELF